MAVAASSGAGQRRLIFGANVFASSALVIAIVVMAIWLARARLGFELDLTAQASNSLSDRTKRMLAALDQDVTITAFYSVLSKYDELAIKRRDTVRDLLTLYDQAGGARVTARVVEPMEQAGPLTELAARLREKPKYKDEATPHREAIEKLSPLLERVESFAKDEMQKLRALAEADQALLRVPEVRVIFNSLSRCAEDARDLIAGIEEMRQAELPRYGAAIQAAKPVVTQALNALREAQSWFGGDAAQISDLAPPTRTFLIEASARYAPFVTELEEINGKIAGLQRVELEQFDDALRRTTTSPVVVVETANEARLLTLNDIWPFRSSDRPPAPGEDPREFAGEASISSAVLQLTQKDRTAVIFVRFGGVPLLTPDFTRFDPRTQRLPTAPFQKLSDLLKQSNFLTAEWNLADPEQKEAPPVEGSTTRVLVVLPPEQPEVPQPGQPRPAGISDADIERLKKAIDASSGAMFLVDGMRPRYEFADYLRTQWGIDAKHEYAVTGFRPTGRAGQWTLTAQAPECYGVQSPVLRFTDHEITRPLATSVGLFWQAAPLMATGPATQPSADGQRVTLHPLVETAESEDWWAIRDYSAVLKAVTRGRDAGTAPGPDDIRSPHTLGYAAERGDKRLIVFGSVYFALDVLAQASVQMRMGQAIIEAAICPANSDLIVNSLHWLSRNANQIAVGPRRTDVGRLDGLREGPVADFWRWFLVAIWPAMTLLVGGGVWLVRRR